MQDEFDPRGCQVLLALTACAAIALCDAEAARQIAPWRDLPPIAPPVNVTDAAVFPEIARAVAGLADMTPERRALLEKEWK